MPKVDSSILSKKDKILSDIEKIIDPKNVLSHTDEIRPYETDALAAYKQAPLLVVLPETVKEVSEILKYCNDNKLPINTVFMKKQKVNMNKTYNPYKNFDLTTNNQAFKYGKIYVDYASKIIEKYIYNEFEKDLLVLQKEAKERLNEARTEADEPLVK